MDTQFKKELWKKQIRVEAISMIPVPNLPAFILGTMEGKLATKVLRRLFGEGSVKNLFIIDQEPVSNIHCTRPGYSIKQSKTRTTIVVSNGRYTFY